MSRRRRTPARLFLASLAVLAVACSSSTSGGGEVSVVGSFYPLAWAAERIGDGKASVIDLTPPGVEAHDTNLTARQVADIQTADIVLLLGRFGFQPQVEQAADRAEGDVVDVTEGLPLKGSDEPGLRSDPHVWLDPVLMRDIVERVRDAIGRVLPADDAVPDRTRALVDDLTTLDARFRRELGGCRFTTFVATHEAFGYLADRYDLHQLGIEGLTPEAEPSAAQLRAAESAIRAGRAAPVVFYEGTDEGRRVARSVANDLGVPSLPLSTLESEPSVGDYLNVMRDNLSSLERGLQCV